MISIIEQSTGKWLYNALIEAIKELPKGQIAIEQIYSGEIPEGTELYFNFDEQKFYLK